MKTKNKKNDFILKTFIFLCLLGIQSVSKAQMMTNVTQNVINNSGVGSLCAEYCVELRLVVCYDQTSGPDQCVVSSLQTFDNGESGTLSVPIPASTRGNTVTIVSKEVQFIMDNGMVVIDTDDINSNNESLDSDGWCDDVCSDEFLFVYPPSAGVISYALTAFGGE